MNIISSCISSLLNMEVNNSFVVDGDKISVKLNDGSTISLIIKRL